MSEPTRVLVFPAGEQNANEAILALSKQVNIELFGCGSVDRLGPHFLRKYASGFPSIQDIRFISELNALCRRWDIDLILPTHDSVVVHLAEHRHEFHSIPMVPSLSTSLVCRDKALFYSTFAAHPFVPAVFEHASTNVPRFVWAKPRQGQGGADGRRIETTSDWRSTVNWESEVVTEFLPGEEITVDCFSSFESELQGVFPRSRSQVLGGISVAGTGLASSTDINDMAVALNAELAFVGMWYFQARRDESGQFKVMEVSARVSGGQALTRARGVNLPLLSVYAHLGRHIRLFENEVRVSYQRVLTSVFTIDYEYDNVYLDLDDTLIVEGFPNPDLLSLLYQWNNTGKVVTLLTRHELDPEETLERHNIHRGLFEQIVHLEAGQRKSTFASPTRSIFIDNAFSERVEVHDSLGIPVFDVGDSEVLRSWLR